MDATPIELVPADWPGWSDVRPLVERAWERFELREHLDALTLVADDLEADERPWLSFPAPRRAVLYCHPDHFREVPDAGHGALPPTLPWEMPEPADDPVGAEDGTTVSANAADRFLHHQLLSVRDLATGVVRPAEVPAELVEAYQEAWSVTIDGRLRRASRPGLPAGERRRRFFRAFSASGVVLPQHWDVFHRLWDDDAPDHEGLLAAAATLPHE